MEVRNSLAGCPATSERFASQFTDWSVVAGAAGLVLVPANTAPDRIRPGLPLRPLGMAPESQPARPWFPLADSGMWAL